MNSSVQPNPKNKTDCLVAAMVHSREMATRAANTRVRNFNFFFILVVAMLTATLSAIRSAQQRDIILVVCCLPKEPSLHS